MPPTKPAPKKKRGTWGGRRPGAGRKPGPRLLVPHRARAKHSASHPVYVTLRARAGVPSFRDERLLPTLTAAIAAVKESPATQTTFRILHFSIQTDHLHLIVEARDGKSLSNGMLGLAVRLARALNAALGLKGRLWRERYRERELTTSAMVRTAILDVLMNAKKHGVHDGGIDPFSSAPWFDGFRRDPKAPERSAPSSPSPVSAPRTQLAATGWREHGRIALTEHPLDER
jgi:REP element-mobilizing transposase RayT